MVFGGKYIQTWGSFEKKSFSGGEIHTNVGIVLKIEVITFFPNFGLTKCGQGAECDQIWMESGCRGVDQ